MSELQDSPVSAVQQEQKAEVTITINNVPKLIHRGRHSVAEIKALGGISAAFELLEVIDGRLTPLPDDGYVTIKEHEVFLSEPRVGRSS